MRDYNGTINNGMAPYQETFQDMNFLQKLGLSLQGQGAVNNYKKEYSLAKLGQDLASDNIDDKQYLKGVAQYDPELYGKMALAKLTHEAPTAIQYFNKMEELKGMGNNLLQQGDRAGAQNAYDKANELMSIIRGGAYGVDTFKLPAQNQQMPTNQGNMPNQGAPQQQPGVLTQDNFPIEPQPITPAGNTLPPASDIARQQAANKALAAGASKKEEQKAILESTADIERAKKEGEGVFTEKDKKLTGQGNVSANIDRVLGYYKKLDEMEAIPSIRHGSVKNAAISTRASGVGQAVGSAIATPEQVERQNIKNAIPRIMSDIQGATGMSAKQMDSIPEMKLLKESIGDPTQTMETITETLNSLRNMYGKKTDQIKRAEEPKLDANAINAKQIQALAEKDPRVKKALVVGHTPEEIAKFLAKGR